MSTCVENVVVCRVQRREVREATHAHPFHTLYTRAHGCHGSREPAQEVTMYLMTKCTTARKKMVSETLRDACERQEPGAGRQGAEIVDYRLFLPNWQGVRDRPSRLSLAAGNQKTE